MEMRWTEEEFNHQRVEFINHLLLLKKEINKKLEREKNGRQ
jgi:hypothetical protein